MNTINENEVRLANLQAVAEMRRAELACIRTGVARQMAKIIEDAVAASGVSGYALRKDESGELRDIDYMTLEGKIDGERLHDIDLRFLYDTWSDEEEGKNRVLSVDTCCFGSIKAGDKSGVAYCVLMGYLATHLQEIQDALNAIPELEAFTRSSRIYRISQREADEFSRKLKEESTAARLAKLEERLVVGAVVATEKVRRYDCEKHQSFYTGVRTMEVDRVTEKLVFFKGSCRQYKKADVLKFLATGLEKRGWSFAADVDMTQFRCPIEA